MKICGIDQSTHVGIAIWDTAELPRLMMTGVHVLDGEDEVDRRASIGDLIVDLHRQHRPDFYVFEAPFGAAKDNVNALTLARDLFGGLTTLLRRHRVPFGSIAPATWRKMAYGRGYKLPMVPKLDRRGDPVLDDRGQPVLKKLDWKTRALQECDRLGIELPTGADRHNAAEAAIIALCWRGATPHGKHSVAAFQDLLTRRNAERKTA